MNVDLAAILESRGLTDVAQEANWTPYTWNGLLGWRYPLFNADGKPAMNGAAPIYRWKCAESCTPENSDRWRKYTWLRQYDQKPLYYLLPDSVTAIRAHYGNVYLASGEPDVLAYRAAGIRNALCMLAGEGSLPVTLADDLRRFGVRQVLCYPDRDTAGMKGAARLREALAESGITLRLHQLPGEMGSKADINRLWQAVEFNHERFDNALLDAPLISETDLHLYAAASKTRALPLVDAPSDGGGYNGLPQGFRDALRGVVMGLEKAKSGANGWVNFCCPLHSEQHPSAGFNFEVGAFKCFVCGELNARDFGERMGVKLADYLEPRAVSLAPVSTSMIGGLRVQQAAASAPLVAHPTIQVTGVVPYQDSEVVANGLIEEIMGERVADTEPMAFPFKTFHQFGGFAETIWPGKLIYISGVSGGGKTSLGETFAEQMLRAGDDVIWYGPEWSPEEMGIRALQRHGGLSMTEFAKLRLNMIDMRRNVPPAHRRGKPISQEERDRNVALLRDIASWPGKSYHMLPSARLNSMQAILDVIEGIVKDKRAAGRQVTTLFFDYLQRAPRSGMQGWDAFEKIAGEIKSLCERLQLFGFVFLQPTKGESSSTRSGTDLNEASGQGISDQQSNLYFTMTPIFDEARQKLPYLKVNVVKNSAGRTGKMYLKWAASHLAIVDEEVDEATVKLRARPADDDGHYTNSERPPLRILTGGGGE